jgi:hypothetical protein
MRYVQSVFRFFKFGNKKKEQGNAAGLELKKENYSKSCIKCEPKANSKSTYLFFTIIKKDIELWRSTIKGVEKKWLNS